MNWFKSFEEKAVQCLQWSVLDLRNERYTPSYLRLPRFTASFAMVGDRHLEDTYEGCTYWRH
ncbi:hypothetical protein N7534_004999 [Penicillium rubens]|nr:hypothetical protein N7534_004999 [Penicillium rubens]